VPVSVSAQVQSGILNSSGSSRKFWEISLSGNSFTVRFGRIGTAGQSQTKTFADEARAKREAENLVAEKLKKGYVEQRT
jgi:predicted DNA-binding WGR domain protein